MAELEHQTFPKDQNNISPPLDSEEVGHLSSELPQSLPDDDDHTRHGISVIPIPRKVIASLKGTLRIGELPRHKPTVISTRSSSSETSTMSEVWYRSSDAWEPLTQGDLIYECPVIKLTFSAVQTSASSVESDLDLGKHLIAEARDLVVMTQACDLEHAKVSSVVLCPHYRLQEFKEAWD